MTWVLYVMIMTEARTLQGILSQHYFNTEQECNQFYIVDKSRFARYNYTEKPKWFLN
jgi:hypothetical protein